MEIKLKINDVKNHRCEYDITGEISVQNVSTIMEEFAKTLSDCTDLTINLRKTDGFDTAAFQMFYSVKNSFVRDKKQLKVTCDLSEDTAALLAHCGINNLAEVLSIATAA
ncbi:MAG: anti-sigma factor antagonist [Bacteroidales bacterium]|nr:anti-sigma factor antagonist [Bacteroidales bacterium]